MRQSMTGFAAGQGTHGAFSWSWDIRGVNAKGLDLRIRVPDWIDGLETRVRQRATAHLRRGNVTIQLRLLRDDSAGELRLNDVHLDLVLGAMVDIENQATARGLSLRPSSASDIVALRGILDESVNDTDVAELRAVLLDDYQRVLASFCNMRATEGAALHKILNGHLDDIERLVVKVKEAVIARRPKSREALQKALRAVLDNADRPDATRLEQELALIAVKSDITEEINRLAAHIEAARGLLTQDGSIGRKLDFLMQEFNREANTLCAKSNNSALTALGLDLKAVIDQMREQVQNVE